MNNNDLQADLTADLLRDLSRPAALPSAASGPAKAASPVRPGTPALSVTLTPLQWSGLRVRRAAVGTGVAVRVGPWKVELGF